MRREEKLLCKSSVLYMILTVLMVLVMVFGARSLAIVSHAQSQGKVVANSANIRKAADPSSEGIGSAAKNAELTINFQTTGTDGKTWYQVFVDAQTLGYIRADLVEITDGSTPGTQNVDTATVTPPAPTAEVTAMNPVTGTVKGSDSVRVRSDANTKGNNILTTVSQGTAVTVTGSAAGDDGKVWYQVTFTANNKEITGFIRSDYVELASTPTETPTEETPKDPAEAAEPEAPQEPEETPEPSKPYETAFANDKWYLYDYEEGQQYPIMEFISAAETNSQLYQEEVVKVKKQKTVIIILVILLVVLAMAVAFLVYKLRDMLDSAYFSQVEKDTLNRRTAQRPAPRPAGQRPAGQRPAGQASQGQRPAGQASQGQRPAGQAPQGQRPAGQRPAGQAPQGQRPAGQRPAGQAPQGQRPAGQRPAGQAPQGQRPAGQRPADSRPMENGSAATNTEYGSVSDRPAQPPRPAAQRPTGQRPAKPPRNFAQEDDEFEFEFLNWEGDEE